MAPHAWPLLSPHQSTFVWALLARRRVASRSRPTRLSTNDASWGRKRAAAARPRDVSLPLRWTAGQVRATCALPDSPGSPRSGLFDADPTRPGSGQPVIRIAVQQDGNAAVVSGLIRIGGSEEAFDRSPARAQDEVQLGEVHDGARNMSIGPRVTLDACHSGYATGLLVQVLLDSRGSRSAPLAAILGKLACGG